MYLVDSYDCWLYVQCEVRVDQALSQMDELVRVARPHMLSLASHSPRFYLTTVGRYELVRVARPHMLSLASHSPRFYLTTVGRYECTLNYIAPVSITR